MAEKTFPALMPTYYKKFHCIGPDCTDNCCREWGAIHINKANYMKIKNARIADKEFAGKLGALYTRIKHSPDTPDWKKDVEYAILALDPETKRCPLQSKEGWCTIHAKLGPEYLSQTCQKYPRMITAFERSAECGLTASCVEVARLMLFEKEGIGFEFSEIAIKEVKLASNTILLQSPKLQGTFMKHFLTIRNGMIDILQQRKYSVDDRMIILGIVMKKVSELAANEQLDEIPGAIASFDKLIETGAFDEGLQNIQSNADLKASAIRRIASIFHNANTNFTSVHTMRKTIEAGYQIEKSALDNHHLMINQDEPETVAFETQLNNRYNEGYETLLAPFLKDHDYILENFMVNEVFSKTAQFNDVPSLWDVYIRLCAVYAYVKFVLCGVLLSGATPTNDVIAETFVAIEKAFSYNNGLCNIVVERLHYAQFDDLATMTLLVRK